MIHLIDLLIEQVQDTSTANSLDRDLALSRRFLEIISIYRADLVRTGQNQAAYSLHTWRLNRAIGMARDCLHDLSTKTTHLMEGWRFGAEPANRYQHFATILVYLDLHLTASVTAIEAAPTIGRCVQASEMNLLMVPESV